MPISLQDIAQRRKHVQFTYFGEEVELEYRVEHITKEFRAETLRMTREGVRIQRRAQELIERITTVTAADDTEEAIAEDAAAEEALVQLNADDAALKRRMDEIVAHVVAWWDVTFDDKKVVPLEPDSLTAVPADFERAALEAVIADAQAGESNTAPSKKPLSFTSKQKEEPETLHQRRSG